MAAVLKNDEVTESGEYIMTRTDDVHGAFAKGADVVTVVEFKGEFYIHSCMETPISQFDEECRWQKYVEPPRPVPKEQEPTKETGLSGLSRHWVLNQLAGMYFTKTGEAYDYMKRCIEASDKAEQEAATSQTTKDGYVIFNPEIGLYFSFSEEKKKYSLTPKLHDAELFDTGQSAKLVLESNLGSRHSPWKIIYVTAHIDYMSP